MKKTIIKILLCLKLFENSQNIYLEMSQESGISSVLSCCNKNLKRWMDQHYSPWTPVFQPSDGPVFQLMLQPSFIQKVKENTFLRSEGMSTQKMEERPLTQFRLHFLYVFSPPLGPALCKLGQPGVLFVLLEVLTPVLRPSFALFLQAFPFLVFQPPPFWIPFSYSNYLTEMMLKINEQNINLQSYKKKLKTNANKKDVVMQIKAEIKVIETNTRNFFFFFFLRVYIVARQ